MKTWNVGVIVGIVAVGAGVAVGYPLLVLAGGVIAGLTLFLATNRLTRERWETTGESDLSNESRTLLRPILRLQNELESLLSSATPSASVRAVSHEAMADARHITDQCLRLLKTRDRVKAALKGRGAVEMQLQRLEDAEGEAVDRVRAARLQELGHYTEAMQAIPRIDSQIQQAEAALAEMKARLVLAVSRESGTDEAEGVREAVGRLRAMSATIDEAEDLLKGQA